MRVPFPPAPAPTHPLDPWGALLPPARQGRAGAVFDRSDSLRALLPPERHGALDAVLARALFALGRPEAAQAALQVALDAGALEARQLAVLARPDGAAVGLRLLDHPCPGVRADAACDLAARAVQQGDVAAARGHVDRALVELPHHAEARRWHRALRDGPLSRGGTRPDARALCPTAREGWLSEERALRRLAAGTWTRRAPPGSALQRLHQVGAVSRILGTDLDYADRPACHPLAAAERALDQALSLEREGHAAGPAAHEAWRRACATDAQAQRDAAGALAALGVRDPSAAPMGLVAIELLVRAEPRQLLWPAYEARLLAGVGAHDLARLRCDRLLARPDALDPVAFGLCIDALRAGGAHRAARAHTRAALHHPVLAPTAHLLLADWDDPVPFTPVVSDRIGRRAA